MDGEPAHVAEQATGDLARLSERELQVSRLIARGQTNKEIAVTLGISPRTVQIHVSHIFEKLGVHTRACAAVWLVEHVRARCPGAPADHAGRRAKDAAVITPPGSLRTARRPPCRRRRTS